MKWVPTSRQHWVSKQACGFCAVGVQSHDSCPQCGEPENATHVLICQDVWAKKKWQHDVTILNSWMLDWHTSPAIQLDIIHNLRH
jgi:predicted amidophosphoribosyltransferase